MIKVIEVSTHYIGMSELYLCDSSDDIDVLVFSDEIAEKFDGYIGCTDWEDIEDYEERIDVIIGHLSYEEIKIDIDLNIPILPGSFLEIRTFKQLERDVKIDKILN